MEEYKVNDVTDSELKFGYWMVTNKQKIKKVLLGLLIFLCVAIWIAPIYGLVVYFIEFPQDKQIINSMASAVIDYRSFIEENKPKDLRITQAQVIYTGANKYDFVARVTNPNQARGVVNISYQFISGDYITPTSSLSILPNQTVYLLSLANQSASRLAAPTLKIMDIKWQDLRSRLEYLYQPFEISEPVFKTSLEKFRSSVNFTAANISIENFWQVDFQAILFSGNKIVGVNQITLEEFLSNQEREVEISWFERLPRVSQAEVVPIVDIYNPENLFEIPSQAVDF